MGLMFQWRKMGNKETIHLKYIKPGSNVVSLPVIPMDLYSVFQKFKTLKSLTPIIKLFLLDNMLCEIRGKELTMVLVGLPDGSDG